MKKFILILFMSFLATVQAIHAQNTADKLYAQGVTYMKTMTIASQKKAISSFEKAKIAYDSQAKKNLCDEQIVACKNIIQRLNVPTPKPVLIETPVNSEVLDTDSIAEIPNVPEATLNITPSEITVAAKGGKYIEISVESSIGEWQVESCPEWITYTSSSSKLLIKAEKNKDKSERAGIILLVANNAKAELIVKQLKAGIVTQTKTAIRDLLKK